MIKFLKQRNKAFTRIPKFGVTPKGGGFTLVETLVAISIFTTSILGLISVLGSGISNTSYAKQKITAEYLAQEGIEYIRNMRDTYVLYPDATHDWSEFKNELNQCNNPGNECGFDNSVTPFGVEKCNKLGMNNCKLYLNDGYYSSDSTGTDSGFVRKIWMVPIGSGLNEVKILSNVTWNQGSKSVTLSENLFDWIE